MKIEHVALQVADPVALSKWYVEHLGLTVKRAQTQAPFGHFLADDGDAVMLEFYGFAHIPVPGTDAWSRCCSTSHFRWTTSPRRGRG